MADARNLSLMIFPQRWTGSAVIANLLLVPNGDPTAAVGAELPFSQAQPVLRAAFLPGFNHTCWESPITTGPLVFVPLTLVQPPSKTAIFTGLKQQFAPIVPARTAAVGSVKKDLPQSYLSASGVSNPDPALFTSIDGYGCDLRNTVANKTPVAPRSMAWGEALSYALRQPLIAQAMGISYLEVSIPFTPDQMANGGWLWFVIDTTSPANWYSKLVTSSSGLAANLQPVRSYAARIPALTVAQPLFAAVLFPTFPTIPTASSLVVDPAQLEADTYVAGFTQLVHAFQPDTADAAVGNDPTLVPGTDAGFQIGWDDQQVTVWMQRQVATAQALAAGKLADEFPLGVHGYRIDARQVANGNADPAALTPAWNSLVAVNATVQAGTSFTASAAQELAVEPTPVSNGGSTNFWLPRYFAHWRAGSLVVPDPFAYAFGAGDPPKGYPQNPAAPQFSGTLTEDINITLRYGGWYQFRARLADLTGGGPLATDTALDSGVATVQFLRYVPPKAVAVALDNKNSPTTITVTRPRLNYPEMVFAGAANTATLNSLLTQLQAKTITAVFLPDPDVVTLEVIVEAQAPVHDTGNAASLRDMKEPPQPGDLDGQFRVIYRQQIPFTGDTVALSIQPQAFSQIRLIPPPAPGSTTLTVPTGRNLRIRMRALGSGVNTYWGSTVASTGLVTDVQVRFETTAPESEVLLNGALAQQLQAFYLREDPAAPQQAVTAAGVLTSLNGSTLAPGLQSSLAVAFQSAISTPIQNLAQALSLPLNGMTLTCSPGKRVLFGAQSTLRHSITQDGSSITFSSMKDFIGHWIVVIRVTLNRDWTYSGIAQNGAGQTGFLFSGAANMTGSALTPAEVGRVKLPGVVSALSVQANGDPAQRDTTELIFFATVDSTVGPDQFPNVTNTAWSLSATFTGVPPSPNLWNGGVTLPVTLNPRQTPKLVSAGLAESPYIADPQYASTEQRQRSLWLEFDTPPLDPNDEFFYRVVGYGPDPLLMTNTSDLPAQAEPALPLDPEWIRMIAAGDSNDGAGLGAMTSLTAATAPLNPAGQPVHYAVPLPESLSVSSLELFGFWTIELRAGHIGQKTSGGFVDLWSTAQGRYGRPLRVSGVQFPPPPLTVSVDRQVLPDTPSIVAVASLAQTVYNGVSLTAPLAPKTQIWFLLYAQVQRVDGQAWRNILLAKALGVGPQRGNPTVAFSVNIAQQVQIPVRATFVESDVEALLKQWRLPPNTPTSVLAVELFGGESAVIPPPPGALAPASAQDPLGANLGAQRILRVSPLTPVRAIC